MHSEYDSNDSHSSNFRTESIRLPEPRNQSDTSIEHALWARKSTREFKSGSLSLVEIGQLLWAAQGISRQGNRRPTPSAGATYPLELYLITQASDDLPNGVYHYFSQDHRLDQKRAGNFLYSLSMAAHDQTMIEDASAVIAITAIFDRTTSRYPERGVQYVHMEVGCAAQNIQLQGISLDVGTVFLGAFEDELVCDILELSPGCVPLCLMPAGRILQHRAAIDPTL